MLRLAWSDALLLVLLLWLLAVWLPKRLWRGLGRLRTQPYLAAASPGLKRD